MSKVLIVAGSRQTGKTNYIAKHLLSADRQGYALVSARNTKSFIALLRRRMMIEDAEKNSPPFAIASFEPYEKTLVRIKDIGLKKTLWVQQTNGEKTLERHVREFLDLTEDEEHIALIVEANLEDAFGDVVLRELETLPRVQVFRLAVNRSLAS